MTNSAILLHMLVEHYAGTSDAAIGHFPPLRICAHQGICQFTGSCRRCSAPRASLNNLIFRRQPFVATPRLVPGQNTFSSRRLCIAQKVQKAVTDTAGRLALPSRKNTYLFHDVFKKMLFNMD